MGFEHMPLNLRKEKDLAKIAVKQSWKVLAHLHPDLRGDPDLINPGLKQDGLAIKHASEDLRCDPKYVQRAIKKNWSSLRYVVGPDNGLDADAVLPTNSSKT